MYGKMPCSLEDAVQRQKRATKSFKIILRVGGRSPPAPNHRGGVTPTTQSEL